MACGIITNSGVWLKAAELDLQLTGYDISILTLDPLRVAGHIYQTSVWRYGKYDYSGVGQEYLAFDIKQHIDNDSWDDGPPGGDDKLTLMHLRNNITLFLQRLDTNRFALRYGEYGGTYSTTDIMVFGSIPYEQLRYLAIVPFVIKKYVMEDTLDKPKCGLIFVAGYTPMVSEAGQLKFRTFFDFLEALDTDMTLKTNYNPDQDAYTNGFYVTMPLSRINGGIPGEHNMRTSMLLLGPLFYRNYEDVTLDVSITTTNNIADASVTLRPASYVYDGTAKEPMIRAALPSGYELTNGVDYVATYHNNIEVGTAYVQMIARGDFIGTKRVYFNIYSSGSGGGNPNIPPSGPGGGGGDGPPPSDPIPEPEPLVISSADTGFTRIYNPTLPELQDFAHYMWTDGNILQTVINHVKQYFEDPMDAFIALNILPVQVPNSATAEMVRLLFIDTGKYMKTATNQFVTVELGELTLSENYKSALDYAPNTKIDLFLPYIGTVPIDADEVMGRTVKLTYKVDICSGTCVAILKVKLDDTNFYPLYQFSGNCAIRIPFTSANMDGYINAGIGAAKIALGAVVGGALGAAAAAAAPPSTTSNAQPSAPVSDVPRTQMNFINPARSSESVAVQEQDKRDSVAAKWNNIATVARASTAAIGIRAGAKASFAHSSGFIGNSGYMSYKVPFFIMKVPRLVNPDQYGKYNGFPSLMYENFENLKGYTEIQQVQLTNMTATSNEKDEIQSLLKSGVIF